ncbi:hypothetical protein WJX73_006233 [Symbiochloris irregularis]|uniref:Magnesium transporter n=1 Tax=Symbiochloris irregularis TaxID=706552 RepID=A0AAW1P4F3_9CHLO
MIALRDLLTPAIPREMSYDDEVSILHRCLQHCEDRLAEMGRGHLSSASSKGQTVSRQPAKHGRRTSEGRATSRSRHRPPHMTLTDSVTRLGGWQGKLHLTHPPARQARLSSLRHTADFTKSQTSHALGVLSSAVSRGHLLDCASGLLGPRRPSGRSSNSGACDCSAPTLTQQSMCALCCNSDYLQNRRGKARQHFQNRDLASSLETQQLLQPQSAGDSPSALFEAARSSVPLFQTIAGADDERHKRDQDSVLVEHIPGFATVGSSVYEVLKVDPDGHKRLASIKRRDLLRANRLQPRDLRRFDPTLGLNKSSDITIKENILLITLGGIRAIIAARQCLLFEPDSPSAKKFQEIAIARRQQAAEALELRGGARGPEAAPYLDESDVPPPFELDMLESALILATGRLEAELLSVSKRATSVAQMLPRNVTPVNLEVLRRLKLSLVELESKAASLRALLEELMDDEEELAQLNLSTRPLREDKQRNRERKRLQRGQERERELAGEDGDAGLGDALRQRLAAPSSNGVGASSKSLYERRQMSKRRQQSGDVMSRSLDELEGEGTAVSAQEALEEMEEAEAAEAEVEELEDLLDYYLQRAASTQTEAERLLAGARDLEESIGVSLSARRFEVNRLELALSIGSFAAAIGAVVAGIFGMNLKSTFEESIIGFWGTTAAIIVGCFLIFAAIFQHTRRRRIL